MTADEISKLIEQEATFARFIPLAEALSPFRVKPSPRLLRWPYGAKEEKFTCWVIADLRSKKAGLSLAYSEFGHGNYGDRWGIISDQEESFGRDDSWFTRLEDAFIAAGVWEHPLPEHYEVR